MKTIISIIIPVYNSERTIIRCLESIINQIELDNLSCVEIIIVDDGSNDNSPQICDDFSKKYEFVRSFHKENGGSTSARKFACRFVEGEYVLCVDSDDYINSGLIISLLDYIENYEPDIVAFSYCCESGIIHNYAKKGYYDERHIAHIVSDFFVIHNGTDLPYGTLHYNIWTKLFRSSIFIKNQLCIPDTITIGEDAVLVFKNLKESKTLIISDYVGYSYCYNSSSVMQKFNKNVFFRINELIKELETITDDYSVYFMSLTNLLFFLSKAAQSCSLKSFLDAVHESYSFCNIWEKASSFKIKKPKIKTIVKLFLIKKRFVRLFYFLCKILPKK